MATRISTELRHSLLNGTPFATVFNYGAILVYSGAQPASADAAATGTLLGRITKDGAAWAHGAEANGLRFYVSGGVAYFIPGQDNYLQGIATGTAGWFRLVANPSDPQTASPNFPRVDGACGVGSGELDIPSLSITASTLRSVPTFSYRI